MRQVRIGVICEGPTDFHAIRCFMGLALEKFKIKADFIDIQPDMGRTFPEGGWGNIECWLKRNSPEDRIKIYLEKHPLTAFSKSCDMFLIQMDSDVIDDHKFQKRMVDKYNVKIPGSIQPDCRGRIITKILKIWSDVENLTEIDIRRHIFAPAVESTEAWCVAAFNGKWKEPEILRGADLVQAFMETLEQSEGLPVKKYTNIDKSINRRSAFCERHKNGYNRVISLCPHFRDAVDKIHGVANAPANGIDDSFASADLDTVV